MESIAEAIRSHHSEIIQCWMNEATRAASARGLDQPEFRNIMPSYLASLAEARASGGDGHNQQRQHVESHVSARLRQGFHVAEVVEEFAILGRCITQTWATTHPDEQPAGHDVERLYTELHVAMETVAELFGKHLLEEEQTEKRYLRLLQKVASEALGLDEPGNRNQLKELLEIILEAMGARSGALLLYEPGDARLVTAASAGAGNEQLERYATSLEPKTFPGSIVAAGEETCSLRDAMTTTLKVSESLRQGGIHALLGVRLPAHRALMGVLYVGLTEAREFTAREKQRLQTLGQHLSVHLENARLYTNLQEKVEALETERGLREQFVTILAHDLRGPLSTAKMGAHALLRAPEKLEARRDLAQRINRNIERADQMVRDLLDANRIHAGQRLPLRLDTCDLGRIAHDVVEELTMLHGERFVLEAEEHVQGIWSAEELRRALWNLGTNALKYGAADSPITFTVTETGAQAQASVHNQGPAIARADQEAIFKPFIRTRAAKTGPSKGWGLGLTLVWGCAQAHGGRVELTSDADTGTTFRLVLPWDARPFQADPNVPERVGQDSGHP
ncbi:adaptive-response sensory-kinase [Corallococcus coralloides DSM 2259]|uniref:histidine kinase n=1 Tax=Corallococcus coralloides (strain ATCC 25202 / DSM 2259 / NBRC 100086 / M2) TaxID=1144275 RepID=H8N1X3_CORCM|nr:ATP-binding protein [Corallococcus coralloides]AFE10297.1 adaptive-response sensory-kinase [Corallococcus coralloides DSM 2259]